MTSYEFEHSVEAPVSAAAVWALYSDISQWTSWDQGLSEVTLDGPFEAGVSGKMTIPGQPAIDFTLTSVDPGREFTDETLFNGAVLRFRHVIEPVPGGVRVTHRVEITGPGAREMGPMVTSDVPEAMEALVALAS
ncbi:hypothetical protein Lesp02_66970 [Lentzea sp. NBRC 105346]|uniref:SRPBCC family protein n=1 Tax=Lentzea sp. NBRC 105346 TaxID=3032205 RepID=UPI0024A0BFDE|nr:SRPBCC family protein [Lentzea sp. NBRC 105346]GLZ34510.1 hypothetical protein Lesp02_66970 [Lentzea sp. NBRC 105346]